MVWIFSFFFFRFSFFFQRKRGYIGGSQAEEKIRKNIPELGSVMATQYIQTSMGCNDTRTEDVHWEQSDIETIALHQEHTSECKWAVTAREEQAHARIVGISE